MSLRKKWLRDKLVKERSARKFDSPIQEMKPIFVSDYLSSKHICFFETPCTQEVVLNELVGMLSSDDSVSISNAIREREESGSTVVTSGIAFPHARISGLGEIRAVLGICSTGIQTNSEEDPIRLFFLFVSPVEDTRNHLRFLTSASSLFLKENFLHDLMELKTREAVWLKILESEVKNKKVKVEMALSNA